MTREEWDRRLWATDTHPLAKTERNMKIMALRRAGMKYEDIGKLHGITAPAVGRIVRRHLRRGIGQ